MKKINALLLFYIFLALLFFYFVALDVLNGHTVFQFYADSKTYEEVALYGTDNESLTEVSHNTYGPVAVLKVLGPRNYWLIFFHNILIFLISFYFLTRNKNINVNKLAFLILLQPITFTSLRSINKELICLLCVSLIIYNHERQNKLLCIILIGLTYLARWQFTLFYILYLLLFSKLNFWKERRLLTTIVALVVITAGLFAFRNTFLSDVFSIYDRLLAVQDAHGAGTFRKLMSIQDNYGYIFAFIPKTLFNLIALIRNYNQFFDFTDAYNNTFMFLQTIVNIYILFLCFVKKIYHLKYTYFYLAVIYCMVFSISPVFGPRYLYPALLFVCYELAVKRPVDKGTIKTQVEGESQVGVIE